MSFKRNYSFIWIVLFFFCNTSTTWAMGQYEVVDRNGTVLRVLDGHGDTTLTSIPDIPAPSLSPPLSPVIDNTHLELKIFEDPSNGRRVDTKGYIEYNGTVSNKNLPGSMTMATASQSLPETLSTKTNPTIDLMTTTGRYERTYKPGGTIQLIGGADVYTLSDGSTWQSGAGTYWHASSSLNLAEIDGNTIRYVLRPTADGQLYRQTDYNGGEHSSQGSLTVAGPLVLEAEIGSNTAVMRGTAEISSNGMTWYGEPKFNFYSSVVGSVVPFEVTYKLTSGTWQADTFDQRFSYTFSGKVDFANPISVPHLVLLKIQGTSQVPEGSEVQYYSIATYDNGVERNVTDKATWNVFPSDLATINSGLLKTGRSLDNEAVLELAVAYSENGVSQNAMKTIHLIDGEIEPRGEAWPTFQGNPAHTGYVPTTLEPDLFSIRWQKAVRPGKTLNPVAAADGKVFVSLNSNFNEETTFFAIDARDGETLWSKGFGNVSSVNPPAYGYGNVYIQIGQGGYNGPKFPFLYAFNANTGKVVFQSQFSAQFERYFAPTILDGKIYINGGTFGGMYSFDAFSGQQNWFARLPQRDEWTPALDNEYAYAYLGSNVPGLYVHDRTTGERVFFIPDDNFEGYGSGMDLAPVLGSKDNVITIHDGRLISFDLDARRIAWELHRSFTGQPSVHNGIIYAIDGGNLVAVDEATGAQLHSWTPPGGEQLKGTLVITDTHVFGATQTITYAIELLSFTDVWAFPTSGHLALGNETLYIAGSNGILTAISTPVHKPATLTGLNITGPDHLTEGSAVQITALASYDDGRVRDRTQLTQWHVEPAGAAEINKFGQLTVGELFKPLVPVVVVASYEERGVTLEARLKIDLKISVSIEDFAKRNLAEAKFIKEQVISQLEEARLREEAALEVLKDCNEKHSNFLSHFRMIIRKLTKAIDLADKGKTIVEHSVKELNAPLDEIESEIFP